MFFCWQVLLLTCYFADMFFCWHVLLLTCSFADMFSVVLYKRTHWVPRAKLAFNILWIAVGWNGTEVIWQLQRTEYEKESSACRKESGKCSYVFLKSGAHTAWSTCHKGHLLFKA
jgi:hypothetical protein